MNIFIYPFYYIQIPISQYLSHYMLQIIKFVLESEEYKLEEDQKKVLEDFQKDQSFKQVNILENKEYEDKIKEILE